MAEPVTPELIARRLRIALVPLLAAVLAVISFHARDAAARGESWIPVALGGALGVLALAGSIAACLRPIPGVDVATAVRIRAARLARGAGWAAAGMAAVGALAAAWLAVR